VDTSCPECGRPLDNIENDDEMGSRPRMLGCPECLLVYSTDPAGGLVEVDNWWG
jgi:hypothetical protein